MNTTKTAYPPSIFPEQWQILTGSHLKILAMVLMLIDHTGHILLLYWPAARIPLFTLGSTPITLYQLSRDIGRSAFPIFCFLLVEGFLHTSNRLRYGRNLFLFALISEIPFNYVYTNAWIDPNHHNVFITLFLGYMGLCAWEYFLGKPWLQLLSMGALFWVSYAVDADYDWKGYGLILLLYFLKDYKWAQAVCGSLWLYWEWKACFAFLSINMYNGERGFIRGKHTKYLFYAFYPVHITILLILRQIIFLS